MRQNNEGQKKDMKVIGITGGVGCGKSAVLAYLESEYAAVVTELDEVAKNLQKSGQECFGQIVAQFGVEILGDDGELDRSRLAEIVFRDPEKLAKLNTIVHPKVKEWVREDIARKRKDGVGLYVIEAALLPTAGYESICDEMWYIYAEEPVRRRRMKESRGYTDEKITQMIASQPTERMFRESCGHMIDNSGTLENTKKQIGELL